MIYGSEFPGPICHCVSALLFITSTGLSGCMWLLPRSLARWEIDKLRIVWKIHSLQHIWCCAASQTYIFQMFYFCLSKEFRELESFSEQELVGEVIRKKLLESGNYLEGTFNLSNIIKYVTSLKKYIPLTKIVRHFLTEATILLSSYASSMLPAQWTSQIQIQSCHSQICIPHVSSLTTWWSLSSL